VGGKPSRTAREPFNYQARLTVDDERKDERASRTAFHVGLDTAALPAMRQTASAIPFQWS
jgi:hypothetical protein